MPKFSKPEYLKNAFTCPYCDVSSQQDWNSIGYITPIEHETDNSSSYRTSNVFDSESYKPENSEYDLWAFAECSNCEKLTVWHSGSMIYPEPCIVEEPNEDMPEQVKQRYLEAAKIFNNSPCAATAILRLGLQLLLSDILGEDSTGNIKRDIDVLKERQLDSNLIIALDTVRINGNEAVHPGTIDLNENQEDAEFLFTLMNMIVDQLYTNPRKMREAYEKLPESKRIVQLDQDEAV